MGVAIAVLLLLLVTLGGAAITYRFDRDAPLPVRLAIGAVVGETALGLIGYPLALLWGLNLWTVALAAVPLLLPLLLLREKNVRRLFFRDVRRLRFRFRSAGHRVYYLLFLMAGAAFLSLFPGAVYEQNGSLFTANHHNHGDLPWHMAIIQGFAVGRNFPPEHPEFAGAPLTYPFLSDFIAAQLLPLGATPVQAMQVQNLHLAFALLILLFWWALHLTRSRFGMVAAPLMLLLSGGWGWMTLIADAQAAGRPLWELFPHPPHDTTIGIDGFRWGNLLTTLLVTQRGFLMGLPLALITLVLLWRTFRRDDTPERLRQKAAAGIVAGLVPLTHGHTFLVLLLIGAGMAVYDLPRAAQRWRGWLFYFALAGLLALPQVWVLGSKTEVQAASFLGWQPGWDSGAADPLGWALFWYRNTGPLLLLIPVALIWQNPQWRGTVSPRLKRFFMPFLLCFALGNTLRLAPWVWDNFKVLFYFLVGAAPLVGALLAVFWRRGGFGWLVAPVLLLFLTFSGAIDVWRTGSRQTAMPVFNTEAIAFARAVEQATPPDARILTAPLHYHPVLLTGRRVLCGFNGHLWSHGLDFGPRQKEVNRIYEGAADSDELLRKLQVHYIVIGPTERATDAFRLNEASLKRFPVVAQVGEYRLLAVKRAANAGANTYESND
ncbi:MAG: hypothetical protein OHK0029_08250 [Armatimonadaceae bacterium]